MIPCLMNKTLLTIPVLGVLAVFARAVETKKADNVAAAKTETSAMVVPAMPKASLHAKFVALDRNNDHVIDASERDNYIKTVVATMGNDGKKLDAQRTAEIRASLVKEFEREDVSKDGKVSEAEFGDTAVAAAPAAAPVRATRSAAPKK